MRDGIGGVIVRLEIDHMRQSILSHFSEHQLDLENELNRRLTAAINGFNWDGAVEAAFDACLTEVIRKSIGNAIERAFRDDEVISTLEGIARTAIYRYTKQK